MCGQRLRPGGGTQRSRSSPRGNVPRVRGRVGTERPSGEPELPGAPLVGGSDGRAAGTGKGRVCLHSAGAGNGALKRTPERLKEERK